MCTIAAGREGGLTAAARAAEDANPGGGVCEAFRRAKKGNLPQSRRVGREGRHEIECKVCLIARSSA